MYIHNIYLAEPGITQITYNSVHAPLAYFLCWIYVTMDMGNVESYQTIFVPEGEMTQYRGFGLGTCHRVNSPLTRVIQGGTQCVRGKECQGRTKRGMGGWVLILWMLQMERGLVGCRMRLIYRCRALWVIRRRILVVFVL